METVTMIEKAARAAFLDAWIRGGQMRETGERRWDDPGRVLDPWRQQWIFSARAAIEAMREPTKEMLESGDAGIWDEKDAVIVWRTMLDEALGKTDGALK